MTPGLKHVLRRTFRIDVGRDRRGPSAAVHGKPTVHTDRPASTDARPLTCIAM
jgi:hypothetical protein